MKKGSVNLKNIRKKTFSFIWQIVQCILELCCLIVGFSLVFGVIMGGPSSPHFFENILYKIEDLITEYHFYFMNITVLFMMLVCVLTKNFSTCKFYIKLILLIVMDVGYVFFSLFIYYAFAFDELIYYKLSTADLLVTVLSVLFLQISVLYFSFNLSINKKYIQGVFGGSKIISQSVIILLYFYFVQYTYLLVFQKVGILWLFFIIFILLILFFCYQIFLVNRLNKYCEKIKKVPKDCFVYIYCVDCESNGFFFNFFLKPCIIKKCSEIPDLNPRLNGIAMFREQYEFYKDDIKNNICIGIDCYSKVYSDDGTGLFLDSFLYSVAIREKQLFSSDEKNYISKLKIKYFEILTLKNFKELYHSPFADDFFKKLQQNAKYIYDMKNAWGEFLDDGEITSIKEFNEYLKFLSDNLCNELNRYTSFNYILKGYEAVIHYICIYYLLKLNISLDDSFINRKVVKYVEDGALGSWLEIVHHILKYKKCYNGSFFSKKIGDKIAELFSGINYPGSNLKKNIVKPSDRFYDFFLERLINLRNWTLGHGSSAYVPEDKEIISMYKILLCVLRVIKEKYNYMQLKNKKNWVIINEGSIAFLDKFLADSMELRYVDYMLEKSILVCIKEVT